MFGDRRGSVFFCRDGVAPSFYVVGLAILYLTRVTKTLYYFDIGKDIQDEKIIF